MAIQIYPILQQFPVLLIIKLYKVIPTWKSVDDTLACNIQVEAIEQYFHVVLTNLEVS